MKITRRGFYTIQGPDGTLLKRPSGRIRRVTSRDECYERILDDGRTGQFTINCPDRVVKVIGSVVDPETGDTEPPTAPTGLSGAAINKNRIDLTWNASTDNVGVTGYQVFRDGTPIDTTATTAYSDNSVSPSTQYSYTVLAFDAAGNNSTISGAELVTTPANSSPTWTPIADQVLTVGNAYNLNLADFANDADTDPLTYSTVSGALPTGITRFDSTVSGTPTTSGESRSVIFRVDDGNNTADVVVQFDTFDADVTAPPVPSGLASPSQGANTIDLSWNASTDVAGSANELVSGTASYRLYRDGGLVVDQGGTTYQDSGLSADTEYTYTVSALDVAGNESNQSAGVAVTINQPQTDIALLFTDLTSGPNTGSGTYANGAFVRLYGRGFGSTPGSVTLNGITTNIVAWNQAGSVTGLFDEIIIQPGPSSSTGDLVVTNGSGEVSNGLLYTIDNTRNIREVENNSEFASALSAIASSNQNDIVFIRTSTEASGAYDQGFGGTAWGDDQVTIGGTYSGCAFIGYPGDTANFWGYLAESGNQGGWRFGNGNDGAGFSANDITCAHLNVQSSNSNVFFSGTGGQTTTPEDSGAQRSRLVNNYVRTRSTSGSMTGSIQFAGSDCKALGNYVGDDSPSRPPANNTHHVYIQIGCDNTEIAYNLFRDCRGGHVIQQHTDRPGNPWEFINTRIHSNVIQLGDNGNCRGINISNGTASGSAYVYNNILDRVGGVDTAQSSAFTAINITTRQPTYIYNNTIIEATSWGNGGGGTVWVRSEATTVEVRNNIIWNDTTGRESGSWFQDDSGNATLDSNLYFGPGGSVPSGDANAISGVNPSLVDIGALADGNWSIRDYSLSSISPCRDKGLGSLSAYGVPDYDALGRDRVQGSRLDIGAAENDYPLQSVVFSGTIDQSYDRVTIPIDSGQTADFGAGDFTWEMWLSPTAANTASGSAFFNGNIVVDKDELGGSRSFVISLHAGVPQIFIEAGGSSGFLNATTDIRGAWTHLAITRNVTTGAVQMFVNGVREINGSLPAGDISFNGGTAKNGVIEIGGEKHFQGTSAYFGSVSEIRLSDTIRYISNFDTPTAKLAVDTDTVGYWDFSEGSGSVVYDRVGDSDATVVFNGGSTLPSWSSGSPF